MKMMRILGFVAPCLATGRAAMSDTFTNGLLQDNSIDFPLRRQLPNSTSSVYELVETYDASNFWDKFEFIEVHIPPPLRDDMSILEHTSKLTYHLDYADQRRSHSWFRLVSKPERS